MPAFDKFMREMDDVSQLAFFSWRSAFQWHPKLLYTVIATVIGLCCWRLWRFTVLPRLRPTRPKEIPYWIPYLGNTVAVLRSLNSVFESGLTTFGSSEEPFSINVCGQIIYFVLRERDISLVLRGMPGITHEDHVKGLFQIFGSSEAGLKAMYQEASTDVPRFVSNPDNKSMALLAEDLLNRQFLPRALLGDIETRLLEIISLRTEWDSIASPALLRPHDTEREISLIMWTKWIAMESLITTFFGEAIWELSPSIREDLLTLDAGLLKMFFRIPWPWSRDIYAAQERLRECLVKYLQLSPDKKQDRCWAARVSEAEMRVRGMEELDIASVFLAILWGNNANPSRVMFWLLARLATNPELLAAARPEIDRAVAQASSRSDLGSKLENSPFLSALYDENLRMCVNSSSERTLSQNVTISGKVFQAGARIMLPYRQLAMRQEIFGPSTGSFRPERFLGNKRLRYDRNFKAFGGGKHVCPGRFLTRKTVLVFVALVCRRFEVEALGELPEMEFENLFLGAMDPSSNFRIILRRRKH